MGRPALLYRPASSFSPRRIADLVSWWDASQTWTLAQSSNGTTAVSALDDPVGYWKDLQGTNNVVQSIALNRPTYKPAGLNSRPCLRFDGTNDALRATPSATIGGTAVTMYSVWAVEVAGTYVASPLMLGAVAGQARPFDRWQSAGSNLAYVGNAFATASLGLRTKTTPFVYGIVVTKDGVSSGVHKFDEYADSVAYSYTVTSTYSTTSQAISVGARTDSATVTNCFVSELMLFNRALTASERARIEDYLSDKWGI